MLPFLLLLFYLTVLQSPIIISTYYPVSGVFEQYIAVYLQVHDDVQLSVIEENLGVFSAD